MIIDFHTHSINLEDEELIQVYIATPEEIKNKSYPTDTTYHCLGIHPWYTDKLTIKELTEAIDDQKPFAIGETGIDRECGETIEKQRTIFEHQIDLALKYNITKIIIHNVKSHGEILEKIKKHSDLKFFLHDFNASSETIHQYLKFDNCYFSLSPNVFNTNFKIHNTHIEIPLNRIFLETDDSNMSIKNHYDSFARLRGIDTSELVKIMEENFNRINS